MQTRERHISQSPHISQNPLQLGDVLFDLAGVGVVQLDLRTGYFVRVNVWVRELLGYSEAELLGLSFRDVTHPDDLPEGEAAFLALQRGEQRTRQMMVRCLRKDGASRWLELHVTLFGEGEQACCIGVLTDVTARERAATDLAFLAEISWDLVRLTVEDEIMAEVGAKIGSYLSVGGCCFFGADEATGEITVLHNWQENRRENQQKNQQREGRLELAGLYSSPDTLTNTLARFIRTGEARVVRDALTDKRTDGAYAAFGLRSFACVPLSRDEGCCFAIGVYSSEARDWQDDELGVIRDLAARLWERLERACAETALLESEAKYRTLFESIDEAALLGEAIFAEQGVPTDYRILEVNPAAQTMAGYPRAALVGKRVRALYPALEAAWFDTLRRVVVEGKSLQLESPIEASGKIFACHLSPIEGRLGQYVAICTDITERHQAEAEIKRLGEKNRNLLESITENFAALDRDWRFSYVNANILTMLGKRSDELLGRRLWEVFPDFTKTSFARFYRQVMKTRVAGVFEDYMATHDRWYNVHGYPTDEGMAIFIQDVSERKRAEIALIELNETLEQRVAARTEALESSERRFAQVFRVAPIAACITTLGGGRFLEVNEAFSTLTGYRAEDLLGKTARELGLLWDAEGREKLSEARRQEAGFHDIELLLRDKAGGVHTVLLSGEVIGLSEERGYLTMIRDVTATRRTEEQMRQALEEVMRDASWFSHRVMERFSYIRAGDPLKPLVELTRRDREVLALLAQGRDNQDIAETLSLNIQTIRNYISTLYSKLEVHSRAEAVVWARERGITGR